MKISKSIHCLALDKLGLPGMEMVPLCRGLGLPAGIPFMKAPTCFFIFISGQVYSLSYGQGVNFFQKNQYQSSKKITKDYKIKHKKNVVEVSSRQT